MNPPLVLVVHGSRDPAADDVVGRIAARLPIAGVRVARLSHDPARALAELGPRPAVCVPLLLTRGWHAGPDLRRFARGHDVVTAPVGPDPALVDALIDRLGEVGVTSGASTPVVLAAVGSKDSRARADVETTAAWLRSRGFDTSVAYATGEPSVRDVVAEVGSHAVVAPYFLAPGVLLERVRRAEVPVAPPLADHPAVIATILARYRAACRRLDAPLRRAS